MLESILVTGANGDIADAIGRIFADALPSVRRFGADLVETGEWPARRTFAEVHPLPRGDAPDYIARLRQVAARCRPTLIIPSTEPELQALAAAPNERGDLPVLMNPPAVVMRFLDKLETVHWLTEVGAPAPRTMMLHEADMKCLPLVIKPRRGRGSRGIEIVRTPEHLMLVQRNRESHTVAQELIDADDAEFTCCILKYGGAVRTLVMRRTLAGGTTDRITVEAHPKIERALRVIAENLPDGSNINVQLRVDTRGPWIFEINPRISGTAMMRHRIGFSDLLWWIAATRGEPLPEFKAPIGARVFRISSEMVVDRS